MSRVSRLIGSLFVRLFVRQLDIYVLRNEYVPVQRQMMTLRYFPVILNELLLRYIKGICSYKTCP